MSDTFDEALNLYKKAITEDGGTTWDQEEKICDAKAAISAIINSAIEGARPEDYGFSKKGQELEGFPPAMQFDKAIEDYEAGLRKAFIASGFEL